MRNNFYYKSNFGDTVYFGRGGIAVNENTLRDYSWTVSSESDEITGFSHGAVEKSIPALFATPTEADFKRIRNNAFKAFERDVVAKKPGRIYLDGYYLNCYITKCENSDYSYTKRCANSSFTVVSDDPTWKKDVLYSFIKTDDTDGLDFPYDFEFDYAESFNSDIILNNAVEDAKLIIRFYGDCTNPKVTIDDHVYQVNTSCSSGEYIEVDFSGKKPAINKISADGTKTNCFKYRNRESYIFQKLSEGQHAVTWEGDYRIDIVVIEGRSEPEW